MYITVSEINVIEIIAFLHLHRLTFSVILLLLFKQIQIFSSLTINDLFFQ